MSGGKIFRSWRTIALRVCLLESLVVGGCQQSAPPQTRTAHQVRYQLEWVWDGAEKTPDGTAWEVTNDLGYRVRVTRGYVTSYSMELVECPKDTAATPIASLGRLLRSVVEGTAYAGHATGTPNPAAIRPMQVESLTAPTARQVGAVLLAPQTYCQLHYLVARAGREAPGLPADLDMVDTTLHIDGTYRAPGATADTAFTLHTAVAYGALIDHAMGSPAAIHVDTGKSATHVTIRRHLGRIFDSVDFVKMTDRMIAGQVLKSLIDHVEVAIESVNENA